MDKQTNKSATTADRPSVDDMWDNLQQEIASERDKSGPVVAEPESQYLNLTKRDESIIRRKIEEFEEKERKGEVRWYSMEESYKMIMEALHSGRQIQY